MSVYDKILVGLEDAPVVPVFASSAAGWAWMETPEGLGAVAGALTLILRDRSAEVELFKVYDIFPYAWWDLQSQ